MLRLTYILILFMTLFPFGQQVFAAYSNTTQKNIVVLLPLENKVLTEEIRGIQHSIELASMYLKLPLAIQFLDENKITPTINSSDYILGPLFINSIAIKNLDNNKIFSLSNVTKRNVHNMFTTVTQEIETIFRYMYAKKLYNISILHVNNDYGRTVFAAVNKLVKSYPKINLIKEISYGEETNNFASLIKKFSNFKDRTQSLKELNDNVTQSFSNKFDILSNFMQNISDLNLSSNTNVMLRYVLLKEDTIDEQKINQDGEEKKISDYNSMSIFELANILNELNNRQNEDIQEDFLLIADGNSLRVKELANELPFYYVNLQKTKLIGLSSWSDIKFLGSEPALLGALVVSNSFLSTKSKAIKATYYKYFNNDMTFNDFTAYKATLLVLKLASGDNSYRGSDFIFNNDSLSRIMRIYSIGKTSKKVVFKVIN